MPTYQYACTGCDERFEVVQSFTDSPLEECPACQGRLRKVFSAVGVVFRGSGFYRTDSRAAATSEPGGKAAPESQAASSPSTGNKSTEKKGNTEKTGDTAGTTKAETAA